MQTWLEVRQLVGNVTIERSNRSQPARVGDRLSTVGDAIATGANSSAVLIVDTGIGNVNVAENTLMRIRSLSVAPDQGRITRLEVPRGRIRLQLRRFTSPNSELEIETPAGISGVRGTDFGVAVQPDGKTGVATLNGAVVTAAQGQEVDVAGGFQNFTIPAEPPAPATPLRNDTQLQYQFVRLIEGGVRRIRLLGRVDPVNLVEVNRVAQTTDRDGRFSVLYPALSSLRVEVRVSTPLGTEQVHVLEF
ncbi:FecR domain-containing protein [Oculatella sp. LEGE 06141]|nr:FecR domain-containing protein [Oculatella sp. LEGE 06141]